MSAENRRDRTLRELQPYVSAARGFSGWSFPQIDVRDLESGPPWDYEAIVRARLLDAHSALDLGTGGAEFFARVAEAFAGRIVATEEWHINAPVARGRLGSRGSLVRASAERALPFRDASFDLVVDRHEAAVMAEVGRVVAPGGWFVTQQVSRTEWRELDDHFPRRTQFPDHFRIYQDELRSLGFDVHAREHTWRVAYASLGDIVFMLMVAPWEIPGFDPEGDLDALVALEDTCRTARGIEMTCARYLIEARKPEL